MGLFRKKKSKEEEEMEMEERLAGARKRAEEARTKARRAEEIRRAEMDEKKAKHEEFVAKHPTAVATAKSIGSGTSRFIKTVITSRKADSSDRAGLGRKYVKPKKVYRSKRYKLPEDTQAHTIGRGHEIPNLYGYQQYVQQEGPTDLFAGSGGRERELFVSRREDLTFRDSRDASTNLVSSGGSIDLMGGSRKMELLGSSRKVDMFGSSDKHNLDRLGASINKRRKLF